MEVKPPSCQVFRASLPRNNSPMGASTIEDQSKGQIEAVRTQPNSIAYYWLALLFLPLTPTPTLSAGRVVALKMVSISSSCFEAELPVRVDPEHGAARDKDGSTCGDEYL